MIRILIILSLFINLSFSLGAISDEEWIDHFIDYDGVYITITDRNIATVMVEKELTLTRQSKKSFVPDKETWEEMIENLSYYPTTLEESYKNLLKVLDDIKNKNRIIDDVEFYNLVYETCIYDKTVQQINDLAYFYSKQKNINYELLIQVYEEIIGFYPNRTVAYLNLADTYLGKNDKEKAKVNYKKYIELMKQDNKEEKIPKRVLEFLNN